FHTLSLRCFPLDRQAGRLPVRKAQIETPGRSSVAPQPLDGLVGIDAIRSTAVGYDFCTWWEFTQACFEFAHGHGACTGDVAAFVLLRRADVEDDHLVPSQAFGQLVHRER